jgi:hypothetical protein
MTLNRVHTLEEALPDGARRATTAAATDDGEIVG